MEKFTVLRTIKIQGIQMIKRSTFSSVQQQKLTFMAIFESIIAISCAAYITIHYNTLWLLYFGSFVAPLLLLRTESSEQRGLQLAELWLVKLVKSLFDQFDDDYSKRNSMAFWKDCLIFTIKLPLYILLFVLCFPTCRTISVILTLFLHPINSFKAIPRNWFKHVFCIDIFNPPEAMPGIESRKYKGNLRVLRFSFVKYLVNKLSKIPREGKRPSEMEQNAYFIIVLILIILYIPSIVYRWLLKSTALLYSPLVWLAQKTFSEKLSLKARLENIRRSDFYSIGRFYSLIIFGMFFLKIFLFSLSLDVIENIGNLLGPFMIYIEPIKLPIWQIFMVFNGILSWILYIYSGRMLFLMEHSLSPQKYIIDATTKCIIFIRSVLSLYTISCNLYLTALSLNWWHLPQLGDKLFPWQ